MILNHRGPLDLKNTLFSGQAFRWRAEDGWFKGVVSGNIVWLKETPSGIEFMAGPEKDSVLEPKLRNYLGLNTDLEELYTSMSFDDRLTEAISRHHGMRILAQDPWECLISFICSSASNITRITNNIESLCTAFGNEIFMDGYMRHTFPTPVELARSTNESLRDLGLGYRADYVVSTARMVDSGNIDLMALYEMPYDEALEHLTMLDGVGDKVANCVLLFSLDKPEAFPVDTWIDKALQKWYLGDDKISRKKMRLWAMAYFGNCAGYANHYLFHDQRLLAALNN